MYKSTYNVSLYDAILLAKRGQKDVVLDRLLDALQNELGCREVEIKRLEVWQGAYQQAIYRLLDLIKESGIELDDSQKESIKECKTIYDGTYRVNY